MNLEYIDKICSGKSGADESYIANDAEDPKVSSRDISRKQPTCSNISSSQWVTTPNFGELIIRDHPSLEQPSSCVTYQGQQNYLFSLGTNQLVLKRSLDSNQVWAKQYDEGTPGLFLIRGAYTLISVLMAGFLFVFCVQLVLFLFLGLVIHSGFGEASDFSFSLFFGTLLSIHVLLFGMANAMTIALAFVVDTFQGQRLMKTIVAWDSVLVDWINVTVYILVPLIVGGASLCSGSADWWEYATLAWFVAVFVYYLIFAAVTIYHEVDECLELIHAQYDTGRRSLKSIYKAVLIRQKLKLAGQMDVSYTMNGSSQIPVDDKYTSLVSALNERKERRWFTKKGDGDEELDERKRSEAVRSSKSFFCRLTESACMKLFYEKLEPERYERCYNIKDALEQAIFVNGTNWGLEKLFCRNRHANFVAITDGRGSMNRNQALSSFLCFISGILITLFLIAAALAWFQLTPAGIGIVCGLYILAVFGSIRKSVGLQNLYKNLKSDDKKFDAEADIIYQVHDKFRVTEPKDILCWLIFGIEVIFLSVIPLFSLFLSGNYPVGILFIFVAAITCARRYVNACNFVRKFKDMEGLSKDNNFDVDEDWREKNRLGKIISEISTGNKNDFWIKVFSVFILVFCLLFMLAVALGFDSGGEAFTTVSGFRYQGAGDLQYSSCSLGQGIVTPDAAQNSLVDITFLANQAYTTSENNETQEALLQWFVDPQVVDEYDIVKAFRESYVEGKKQSAVQFKLIGFPGNDLGVISVRGTSNAWDALSDAQLWSSAWLAQAIRALLPLGNWFTSILQYLVQAISWVESSSLEDVAYYKEVSAFAEYIKNDATLSVKYPNLLLTGHSLGGGLAMIAGAQQAIPAVGISGPNALISRLTFSPIISKESLDKWTFNVVPDRDPVPRIDDLAQNYQRIQCKSLPSDPVGCHYGVRTLCETLFTCGTQTPLSNEINFGSDRPIPCKCVTDYGYPEPSGEIGGLTFTEYCNQSI